MAGGPGWINTDRFDVEAKAAQDPPPREQMLLMIRALLADRFKLAVRNETREMAAYALVMARSDGKLGPKLKQVAKGAAKAVRSGPGRVTSVGGTNIASLANALVPYVGRTVLDQTGLSGNFEFELEYAPTADQIPERLAGTDLSALLKNAGIDPNGASLFTAMQEQLGLKLTAIKTPVEIFVIDHAEKPSEN
jgi:uncharacterized protein (TIGR03435 family)